jgi:hypothetical protein
LETTGLAVSVYVKNIARLYRAIWRAKMSLDVVLHVGTEDEGRIAERCSSLYPDHLWTPTWLRSTYNGHGFNAVVESVIGKSLWAIFPATDFGCYSIHPDWEDSLRKAQDMWQELLKATTENPYRATAVYTGEAYTKHTKITNEKEALDFFLRERDQHKGEDTPFGPFTSYESVAGFFYLDKPMEISAVIAGRDPDNGPCAYVVRKFDPTWYLQACEILVKEFIPLGIEHKETAYVVWDT